MAERGPDTSAVSRASATSLDHQRGGLVCLQHVRAADIHALHVGHGIEMNEHDRAHVPMTDAKRLTFTSTPSELRARLADLEARGATEIAFGVRGLDIPHELRAFAALLQAP